MLKTENYNLNKPEATDLMRVSDFNENADKIDAALGVLNAAAAGFGNCKIATGSYNGNGKYGSGTPNTLTFDFVPKVVIIVGFNHDNTSSQRPGLTVFVNGFQRAAVLLANEGTSGGNASSAPMVVSFSGKSVSYYSNYNYGQMNYSGCTYHYVAFG